MEIILLGDEKKVMRSSLEAKLAIISALKSEAGEIKENVRTLEAEIEAKEAETAQLKRDSAQKIAELSEETKRQVADITEETRRQIEEFNRKFTAFINQLSKKEYHCDFGCRKEGTGVDTGQTAAGVYFP